MKHTVKCMTILQVNSFSTGNHTRAQFYDNSLEAVKDISSGSKLLVGGNIDLLPDLPINSSI